MLPGTLRGPDSENGPKVLADGEEEPATRPHMRVAAARGRGYIALLTLLCAESLGLVLFVLELIGSRWLGPFVARNQLDQLERERLIATLITTGLGALGWTHLRLRRASVHERARTASAARAAAPLTLLWTLPPLLNMEAYEGHDLDFLLTASLVVLVAERCLRASLAAWPPVALRQRSKAGPFAYAPAVFVALVAVSYGIIASIASIRLHDKLLTSTYDLGLFENLLFNTLAGAHGIALGFAYFAVHAELLLYGLLPIFRLAPRPETLLIVQSVLLGGAVIPLYLIARRWLRNRLQACALVVVYALYPAVHGPNLYDFHFLTLSVFFVAWSAYFMVMRRWVAFWLAALLAMTCREDVSLGLAAVGLALAWLGYRRRANLVLAVVSGIWFVCTKFIWMPSHGFSTFTEYYAALVAPGESGFGSVLGTLISNPLYVVGTLLKREKLVTALQLLVPLGFLPIRQWRTLPLLLPGILVLGLTSYPPLLQLSFQYVCHFTPYLFVATAAALAVRPAVQRWAAIGAVLLGTLLVTARFGALRYDHIASGFQYVSLTWSRADAQQLADLKALARMIPPNAVVSAGEYEGPHIANRPLLYTVKNGIYNNAEYVVFGLRSLQWGGREAIVSALVSGQFGVIARRGDLVLLRRGAPRGKNTALVTWLWQHRTK
jgi:uncharacterized membrane protein